VIFVSGVVELLAKSPAAAPRLFLLFLLSGELKRSESVARREVCKRVAERPAFAQGCAKCGDLSLRLGKLRLHRLTHCALTSQTCRLRLLFFGGIVNLAAFVSVSSFIVVPVKAFRDIWVSCQLLVEVHAQPREETF
jgi:hypothetical protein